ncbi:MAG: ATP-binding cassette domain-containing protein, partial [Sphaerochaeta sp.]|nr:ATP-binding cassette domain-containing protein [Sphaerochaeta sp.]
LVAMRSNPKDKKAIIKKAQELIELSGIASLEKRDVSQVSGGQLQRAGICRALMNDAKILFCDEPTGALNSKTSKEIMDVLCEINRKGTALVLVTHDVMVASRSQRILCMVDGKIVQELALSRFDGTEEEQRMTKIMEVMQNLEI